MCWGLCWGHGSEMKKGLPGIQIVHQLIESAARVENVMQYPLYVHREGDTRFRGNFPDSPCAVARGKSMDELKSTRSRPSS